MENINPLILRCSIAEGDRASKDAQTDVRVTETWGSGSASFEARPRAAEHLRMRALVFAIRGNP